MADLSAWPPERLRALDEAVALARGWTRFRARPTLAALDYLTLTWRSPESEYTQALLAVSLGCRETFELQIKGFMSLTRGDLTNTWYIELERDEVDEPSINGPTMPIAWCLAYLDSEGVPFNE